MSGAPRVSVVIPSVGRPTLNCAVDSALGQTAPPVEVIVVFDLPAVPTEFAHTSPRVRTLATGGGRGGNVARQIGVNASVGDAIAFLDDDDTWRPEKLRLQGARLQQARAAGRPAVITCAKEIVNERGEVMGISPRRHIGPEESPVRYLFGRRQIRAGEAAMCSSALLVDRDLLFLVLLDGTLPVHQDWDWLVRVSAVPEVLFLTVPIPLVRYRAPIPGRSVSRTAHWRDSLEWARRTRPALTRRDYGNLLIGVTFEKALDTGSRAEAAAVAWRAFRHGPPSVPAVLGAVGLFLLPRGLIEAARRLHRGYGRVLFISSPRRPAGKQRRRAWASRRCA